MRCHERIPDARTTNGTGSPAPHRPVCNPPPVGVGIMTLAELLEKVTEAGGSYTDIAVATHDEIHFHGFIGVSRELLGSREQAEEDRRYRVVFHVQ